MSKIGEFSNITKLAGFEHTEYIQGNCTHNKVNDAFIPLFIGKTVRNGYIDKNFDWYISGEISDLLPRSQLRRKCIVLPYVGSVGDIAIYDGTYPAHLGSNIAKIELNSNAPFTEEFVYYFLKSPYGQRKLLRDIQGGVQKNITMGAIRDVHIPNYSFDEQNKIVSALYCIDNQIKKNNDMVQKLQVLARSTFHYFFADFSSKKAPLSSFIVERKKSVIQVNQIEDSNGTIPFFTSGDTIKYIDQYLVNGFNLFLSTGGNASVKAYYGKASYSTDTWCITAKNNMQFYIFEYLKMIENQMDSLYFHGTGLKHLQKSLFLNFEIPIPSENLSKYNTIVDPIFKNISEIQKRIIKLTNLKDKLLPLLINQQLQ